MNICSEAIRNNMRQKFTEVSHNGKELKYLISQYPLRYFLQFFELMHSKYSDESSYRFQTAKAIFEGMLQLVNDSIDLLKMADQHFVERLVNEANVALIHLKKVREAINIFPEFFFISFLSFLPSPPLSIFPLMTGPNISELVLATQDYTTASVNLVKRLSKRVDSGVLPNDHKQNAVQALDVLKNGIFFFFWQRFLFIISSMFQESANIINVKRNQLTFPGNEMHTIALDSVVKTIVAAVKVYPLFHLTLLLSPLFYSPA
jgi:hypothetical protein